MIPVYHSWRYITIHFVSEAYLKAVEGGHDHEDILDHENQHDFYVACVACGVELDQENVWYRCRPPILMPQISASDL